MDPQVVLELLVLKETIQEHLLGTIFERMMKMGVVHWAKVVGNGKRKVVGNGKKGVVLGAKVVGNTTKVVGNTKRKGVGNGKKGVDH